jgi:Tol biopolymer transport system component
MPRKEKGMFIARKDKDMWVATLAVAVVALLALVAPAKGAFPGSNGKLAFQSDPYGNDSSEAFIYTINADGTGRSNVWLARGHHPAWSPDGSRIAFAGEIDGDLEIWTVKADRSGLTRLTHNVADDDFPAWSPDGTQLVFCSGGELYVMNANGAGQRRLTADPATDSWPAWSADGTRIAFSSNRTGTFEIYTVAPDGSGLTRLTTNLVQDYVGDWSPDGRWIAFHRNAVVLPNRDIWKMRAQPGGEERQLTSGAAQDEHPAWSPDGTRIAFATDRDKAHFRGWEIYTMDAGDGSGLSNVTRSGVHELFPAWQPIR